MRIPIGDQIANRGQSIGNCVLRNHFAVNANPFTERDEVRGCEEAGAISLRATDRIDHGANGAFTVCAGDVNYARRGYARRSERRAFDTTAATTFVEQPLRVFQPKLDTEALEAVEPGERLFV